MKKIITILLVVITLFGCSGKDSAKKIEFRKEIIYTLDGNKPYTGEGVLYYDKNNIESRGYSKNGKPDKEWIYYFYNGKVKRKGSYKNGKMEGHWIYYYYSGEVEGEVNYKDGKEI
jgi:antitoxin component YwqK of YwqJK toxin-antitoxin module